MKINESIFVLFVCALSKGWHVQIRSRIASTLSRSLTTLTAPMNVPRLNARLVSVYYINLKWSLRSCCCFASRNSWIRIRKCVPRFFDIVDETDESLVYLKRYCRQSEEKMKEQNETQRKLSMMWNERWMKALRRTNINHISLSSSNDNSFVSHTHSQYLCLQIIYALFTVEYSLPAPSPGRSFALVFIHRSLLLRPFRLLSQSI